jgi:hypothetical protein
MAITSDLDIVNAACALLSVEPLQAMDEELPGGQAAQLLYAPIIDLCLGLAPWSFARRTRQCGLLAGVTSSLGFAHVHQLPADRVGPPERLLADPARPAAAVWAFDYDEEGRVHSDSKILYAQYTARVLPAMWHPVFRTAAIHAVAAGFCELLTGNSTMAAELQARTFGTPSEAYRGGLMRAALSADARATPARNLPAGSNPLLVAWATDGTRLD